MTRFYIEKNLLKKKTKAISAKSPLVRIDFYSLQDTFSF